jgi:hypothetical protein
MKEQLRHALVDPLTPLRTILESRNELGITSTETYAPVLQDREVPLFTSKDELDRLIHQLRTRSSGQLHCSYFGNPTALFAGPSSHAYQALLRNMGGPVRFAQYYGDLNGEHVITRACQEYELAARAGLDHYTVHFGIDYSFSDGMYSYPDTYGLDRDAVVESAIRQIIVYLRRFASHLARLGLLSGDQSLPTIGIENAGWGLEYGIQTAQDFRLLFERLEEVKAPLRDLVMIDWDFNHLLHALGRNSSGQASFMLPEEERTEEMKALETMLGSNSAALAAEWIRANVLSEGLLGRVRCIHISDSSWKSAPIFARCQALGDHLHKLMNEQDPDARASLGENLVVNYYDNHLHLGSSQGLLEREHIAPVFQALAQARAARSKPQYPLLILHELKGYPFTRDHGQITQGEALAAQIQFLRDCGVFFENARLEVRI